MVASRICEIREGVFIFHRRTIIYEWNGVLYVTLSLHDAICFDHLDFGIVASLLTRYFIFKFDCIFALFSFHFL